MELFDEGLHSGVNLALNVEKVIYREKTDLQDLMIFENSQFGRVMSLDGAVQTTEKDEFIYHEMFVHVPVLAHGKVSRALIIGGGDGGAARQLMKHSNIAVTMVDIDRQALAFQDAGQILQALIYGFNGGTEGVILQKRRFHKPRRKLVYEIDNTLCAMDDAEPNQIPHLVPRWQDVGVRYPACFDHAPYRLGSICPANQPVDTTGDIIQPAANTAVRMRDRINIKGKNIRCLDVVFIILRMVGTRPTSVPLIPGDTLSEVEKDWPIWIALFHLSIQLDQVIG